MAKTWEHVEGAGPRCACHVCRDLRSRGADNDEGFDDGTGLGAYPWGYNGNGCAQCLGLPAGRMCEHHAEVEGRETARQKRIWEDEARFEGTVDLDFDAGLHPTVLALARAVFLNGTSAHFWVMDASQVPAKLVTDEGHVMCTRAEYRYGRWCALVRKPEGKDRQWIPLAALEPVATADASLLVALSPDLCCSLPADPNEQWAWCSLCGGQGGKDEWGDVGEGAGELEDDAGEGGKGFAAPLPMGAATMASAHAANNRGLACYAEGDYAGAMASCGRAMRLAPLSPAYAYNWACAASKVGKYSAAAKGARAALDNDPNHTRAGHLLSSVLLAAAREMPWDEKRDSVLEAALVSGTEAMARCCEGVADAEGKECARCKRWEADRGQIIKALLTQCEGGNGSDSDDDEDDEDLRSNPEEALRRADMYLSGDPNSICDRLSRCQALAAVGAASMALDELEELRPSNDAQWSTQDLAKFHYVEAVAALATGRPLLRDALVSLRQSLTADRVGKAVRLECALLRAAAAHATLFGRFSDLSEASQISFSEATTSLLLSGCPEAAHIACDLRCGNILGLLHAANTNQALPGEDKVGEAPRDSARVPSAVMDALNDSWTSGGAFHEATILLRTLCLSTDGGPGVGAACLAALGPLRSSAAGASPCRIISPMRLEALWSDARAAAKREALAEEAHHEKEAFARAAARRAESVRAQRPSPETGSDPKESALDTALAVLDLAPSATATEVRAAYKRAVMQWHPDRWATRHPIEVDAASERFTLIHNAYEVALAHLPPDAAAPWSMVDSRIPVS